MTRTIPQMVLITNVNIFDGRNEKLAELYGPEKAKDIHYAEAFEICEYGRRPALEELKKLFPIAQQPNETKEGKKM